MNTDQVYTKVERLKALAFFEPSKKIHVSISKESRGFSTSTTVPVLRPSCVANKSPNSGLTLVENARKAELSSTKWARFKPSNSEHWKASSQKTSLWENWLGYLVVDRKLDLVPDLVLDQDKHLIAVSNEFMVKVFAFDARFLFFGYSCDHSTSISKLAKDVSYWLFIAGWTLLVESIL